MWIKIRRKFLKFKIKDLIVQIENAVLISFPAARNCFFAFSKQINFGGMHRLYPEMNLFVLTILRVVARDIMLSYWVSKMQREEKK